jgi:hypothetical protein
MAVLGLVFGAFLGALYVGLRGVLAGSLLVKPQMYVGGRYARLFGLLYLIAALVGGVALWMVYSGVQAGTIPASMLLVVAGIDIAVIVGIALGIQILGPNYVDK